MYVARFSDLALDQRVVLSVRATLLVGCSALTLVQRHTPSDVAAVLLLAAVAAAASLPVPARWSAGAQFQPIAEAVLACVVMLLVEPLPETLLPYLLAPALAAGLAGGAQGAVMAAGLSALVLMLGRPLGSESLTWTSYLAVLSRWSLITLAVGLLGAWVGRLQQVRPSEPENVAYAVGVPPDLPATPGLPAAVRRAGPGDAGPADARERPPGDAVRPRSGLRALDRQPAVPGRLPRG